MILSCLLALRFHHNTSLLKKATLVLVTIFKVLHYYIQSSFYFAAQMSVVVCKSLCSDEDFDHIYYVVVLHPECRRS